MLAKDIIKEVRLILADRHGERWSDDRLLLLLNNGIRDIAKNTVIFTESIYYKVINSVYDVDLSDSVVKFLRADYMEKPLKWLTYAQADHELGEDWQAKTSDKITHLIYDQQKAGALRLYPIPVNTYNEWIEYDSVYGGVTHISYSDLQPTLTNDPGVIASIEDKALIKFYYIRKHDKITDINAELYIDDLCEEPLIHYVTCFALRDNQDAQNRNMANEEYALYERFIQDHEIQKQRLYNRSEITARYRPHD